MYRYILTNASSGYVTWVKCPPIFTYAIRFVTIRFTVCMISTINVITGRFTLHHRWSPYESIVTFAMETTDRIGTYREWTAWLLLFTFIYINTNWSISNKAFLTETLIIDAFGIICTIEIGFTEDVDVDLKLCRYNECFDKVILRDYILIHATFNRWNSLPAHKQLVEWD